MRKAWYWVVVCLIAVAAVIAPPPAAGQNSQNVKTSAPVSLPLVFERNGGQVPAEYGYVARRGGTEMLFVRDGVDIFVAEPGSKVEEAKLRVVGARGAGGPQGVEQLPGRSNYLRGADATKWVTGVQQFGRLRFAGIYEGVDLEFHGTGDDLENDFLVAAGADARAIRLRANAPVRLNANGDLEILVGAAVVELRKPVAYQMVAERRQEVPAKYRIGRGGKIGFELGAYDHTQPLVIDPVFGFSTYLAGTSTDQINAVTTDAAGNVYVTGQTMSVDFPVAHALQPTCGSCGGPGAATDAFVSKLDPTGHTLLLSTFLGGTNNDQGYAIAVDTNSNILVAGVSQSGDFPEAGSLKPASCETNGQCFFASSLKPDGSGFNYSGRVGGGWGSYSNSAVVLAVDPSGDAYLSGTTQDPNFQFTSGSYSSAPPAQGANETFIMKLDPTGALVYSTGIPGTDTSSQISFNANHFAPYAIVVDASGHATIAGTGGLGLPTTGGVLLPTIPPQPNQDDPIQGFALRMNVAGSAVNLATYIPAADEAYGIALDGSGNFLLTGYTEQLTLPVSSNAYQKTIPAGQFGPGQGGFVLKMNAQGTATLGGTYLASPTASGGVYLRGIALDGGGNIFVGGNTNATDFPLVNPITTVYEYGNSGSLVLAELSADFSTLNFGSYLSPTDQSGFGGTGYAGIAVDAQGSLISVGNTTSTDYPTTASSFQPTPPTSQQTYQHGVISKIDVATGAPSVCFASQYVDFGTVDVNTPTVATLTFTNCGNAALTISSVKSSSTTVKAGQACATVAAGATCGIPLTFTATDTSTTSGTITLTDNAATTTQTVQFTGAGGTPNVTLPTSVNAGDALVGTTVSNGIPFTNTGTAPWVVSSVTITGDFTVTNQCTSPVPGAGLQQNNFCQIDYTFTPTVAGARTGTLTIADNQPGSPHAIPISGNGVTSYPAPTITSIDAIPNAQQLTSFYVQGTNFFSASQAIVNGTVRATTFLDENDIRVGLTAADLAQPGELTVTVSNPFPGGGVSNSYVVDVYGEMLNINVLDSVINSKTGHIFATVAAGSTNNSGQLIEIDPQAVSVVNAWNVGGGPDHVAISDDGSLLYVGLDTDHTVAQVALPGGTVNFTVPMTEAGDNPSAAKVLGVLPGKPHSWVVVPCGQFSSPCATGLTVYDDSTARATTGSTSQSLPDQILFIGSNAGALYGTTNTQTPPYLYDFSISASGITLANSAADTGAYPGGGTLESDGTVIYSSKGQVIDPASLATTNNVQGIITGGGIKVDTADSQIYYAGIFVFNNRTPEGILAVGLNSLKGVAAISVPLNAGSNPKIFRYGTNGLATLSGPYNYFFQTSLTGTPIVPSQLAVTGWAPTTVAATAGDVTVAVAGADFAAGDTVTANGTAVTATVTNSSQMSIVIPAAIIGAGGNVTVVITGTQGHTASFVVAVTGSAQPVASVSPTSLTFGAQFVGTTSTAQTVTITNTGGGILTATDIVTPGDFAQTPSCTGLSNGQSCTLSVTFTPTATGSRTSTMTLQFNGGDVDGATVNLTGTGTGLQIAPASGGSTSATVSSGQPATYNLTIAPQDGFTGTVSFSCTGLPTNASCSINPSSATFGTTPATVTVTIATQQTTAGVVTPVASGPSSFGAGKPGLLPALAFAATTAMMMAAYLWMASLVGRKLRMTRVMGTVVMTTMALVGLAALASCGGGSGGGSTSKTPAGTYMVNFVATSSGGTATQPLTLTVK